MMRLGRSLGLRQVIHSSVRAGRGQTARGFKKKPKIQDPGILEYLDGESPVQKRWKVTGSLDPNPHPEEETPINIFVFPTCPHCNKVKTLLDVMGHGYSQVNVNPITKAELKWYEGKRKVPIAVIAENVVQGSDAINLAIYEENKKTHDISHGVTADEYNEWNRFADEEIARPLFRAASGNWTDAWQMMEYVDSMPEYPSYMRKLYRFAAALITRLVSDRFAKKYNIQNAEEELYDGMSRFIQSYDTTLHGGEKPSLVDIVVYGTLRSVETSEAVRTLVDSDKEIFEWYSAMQKFVLAPQSDRER